MATTSIYPVTKELINALYSNDELEKLSNSLNSLKNKSDNDLKFLLFSPRIIWY